MTSLSQALAKAEAAEADVPCAVLASPMGASEDALRLALQLRALPVSAGGRMVMFLPASPALDAAAVVADAVRGLLELHEGPILVLDLREPPEASPQGSNWLGQRTAATGGDEHPWGMSTGGGAVLARPFSGRRDAVAYAASDEFSGYLTDARGRYAHVICIGDALDCAVETLVTAPLVDAVVLSVAAGRTTKAEMLRLTGQLRRARAHVLGFVVDGRPQKGGHR